MINVIVVVNGLVEDNVLCRNSESAEKVFLDKCKIYISNFDEYKQEDIEAILDDGCETFGVGSSICICHPTLNETI